MRSARGEDFQRLVARAGSIVDDVGVIDAYTGEALGQQMTRFRGVSEEARPEPRSR